MFCLNIVSNPMHVLKEVTHGSWSWNKHYGYLSFQGLSLLPKKKMVKRLFVIQSKEEMFLGYALGK
jgi:hypothetical protein